MSMMSDTDQEQHEQEHDDDEDEDEDEIEEQNDEALPRHALLSDDEPNQHQYIPTRSPSPVAPDIPDIDVIEQEQAMSFSPKSKANETANAPKWVLRTTAGKALEEPSGGTVATTLVSMHRSIILSS